MKVTTEQIHPDLRPHAKKATLVMPLFKRLWLIKLVTSGWDHVARRRKIKSLECGIHQLPTSDGDGEFRVRTYRPKTDTSDPLPAMLYIHGGGYVGGDPESVPKLFERFIEARPCVIIAPNYRKALTKPFPAGFDDCYDTLLWARDRAEELGIRTDSFMIAGHSAGGGLAAAVTLKAVDTGDVSVAFQMPIYPMIDDTQPRDPERAIETPMWDTELNGLGWGAYLADLRAAGAEIPDYAAPARRTDHAGLPPTITFVGSLEPFYWETTAYVAALEAEGIDVRSRVFDGCFHAFELVADTPIGREALAFTFDAYADFYDRYVAPAT